MYLTWSHGKDDVDKIDDLDTVTDCDEWVMGHGLSGG